MTPVVQAIHQRGTGAQNAFGRLRPARRIDGSGEPEAVDVVLQLDHRQHLDEVLRDIVGAGGPGRRVVDPVGMDVELGIAGAARLRQRGRRQRLLRSEEHTSELQSLMRISYAVFCLKKQKFTKHNTSSTIINSVSNTPTENTAS